MDVSSYNNIEALKLRAAILEEKIRLKLDLIKYLEEILNLRSEIILLQSKKHEIQIQELRTNSICISTPEGFLPSWNDSFHPGINPSRMEGILPGSYQNLGMTAIPKIQV